MKTIVAPDYMPKDRHKAIFDMFYGLEVNETMKLINDHDPKPLYYQFLFEHKDCFSWQYLVEGPNTFEVLITKIKEVEKK
ncbi:MAG: DUF2249 domain-containing protein [Paracholeplasma sp.]|jgi:uncharacterized protein (DUF2249 family)|nr:DUF2249 domain-containing protein [Paracholeplasma sp.]MDY3196579.1 DUF2249 domain-containing protein [Paracholeplasma sp.]